MTTIYIYASAIPIYHEKKRVLESCQTYIYVFCDTSERFPRCQLFSSKIPSQIFNRVINTSLWVIHFRRTDFQENVYNYQSLTLSWWRSLSYKKPVHWFSLQISGLVSIYSDLHHVRVKSVELWLDVVCLMNV